VSGTQRQQTHPLAGAEDTLKDFWTSRPRRPRRGRKLAGVAAAIGNRYAIDPVIVRVAFVVTAFYGGAGVLLYLFGWLFFPEQNDEEAPFMSMVHQGRSSTSTFFTALLCMAMIGASFWTFNGDGAGLISLILLVIAMYLLHRHRAPLGQQTQRPADPAAQQPTVPMGVEMGSPVNEQEQPRTGPPAWDPLGAAPFAWDLPEPTPIKTEPEPPAPRKRARVGGITLGAALAVGGACALLAPYSAWLSPPHIIGIVLAVIGIGMVGGSLVGGGRGLIGLAVPLALAGFVFTTNMGPGGGPSITGERWGDINEKPLTASAVQPTYNVGGGSVDLDLSAVTTSDFPIYTQVNVGLGNVTVTVPANADVEVTCAAIRGSIDCLGQQQNGMPSPVHASNSGVGPKIHLEARVNTGRVEVRRG
jgi:phage shock protein PspC (stress-responsive transcriptional regulator)